MKILVLGATGGTGMEIIRRAIERKHVVTALARAPEKLGVLRAQITTKQGNPLSTEDLEEAKRGKDAVLSAFGPRVPIAKHEEHLLEQFSTALVSALQRAHVKRVLIESSAFLFRNALFPPAHLLGKMLFPTVVRDATAMETNIQNTQLDWTILRPPRLTDGALSRRYRVCMGKLPVLGFSISRADVADYFLRAVEDDSTIRKVVGLSN
jgi:putative NADH-flavin reductase